jgi:hypothetical protein
MKRCIALRFGCIVFSGVQEHPAFRGNTLGGGGTAIPTNCKMHTGTKACIKLQKIQQSRNILLAERSTFCAQN